MLEEITNILSKTLVNTFPPELVIPKKHPYFVYTLSLEMSSMLHARKKLTGVIRFMYRNCQNKMYSIDEKVVSVVDLINSKFCTKDVYKININENYFSILKKLISSRKYISKKIHYIHIKYKHASLTKAVKKIILEIEKQPKKVFCLINKHKRTKVEFVSKLENK